MLEEYRETVNYWNEVFGGENAFNPFEEIKFKEIENGIHWVCQGADAIIDFGCGNGRVVYRCLDKGVKNICGIDVSENAIELAKDIAEKNDLLGKVKFIKGALEELDKIESNRFGGAILFNIIDNLMPQHSVTLINHIHRVVKPNGKILLKLNPYLPKEQIDNQNFIEISNDFYKEQTGLYLWNLTNEKVEEIINPYFNIENYVEVDFKQYGIINRMYYLKGVK